MSLLESQFEGRLGNLQVRAEPLVKDLARAQLDFYRLCDDLAKLDAEPYVEDLWMPNIDSIKAKKGSYATAIRQMMSEAVLDMDMALNIYYRYSAVLLSVDNSINKILKSNATYKTVLYCYSKYMRPFKSIFSNIDVLRERLRRELNAHEKEAAEYVSLKEAISRFALHLAEIKGFEDSARSLEGMLNSKSAADTQNTGVHKDLEMHKLKLSETNRKISDLSDRISLLTMPLGRASRKLDHSSVRKRHLGEFISDPIKSISSESDYKEFRSMLQELKESVEKGIIEVKNGEELLGSVSVALDSDIYSMVKELESARQERSLIESGIGTLEATISDMHKSRLNSEKLRQDLSLAEEKGRASIGLKDSEKKEIERLFLAYYKKPIEILDV